jgi:hypothetical protein
LANWVVSSVRKSLSLSVLNALVVDATAELGVVALVLETLVMTF